MQQDESSSTAQLETRPSRSEENSNRTYDERSRSRSPPPRAGGSVYGDRRSPTRSAPLIDRIRDGPPHGRRRPEEWADRSRDDRGKRNWSYDEDRPYSRREYSYERPRPAPYYLDDANGGDSRRDELERNWKDRPRPLRDDQRRWPPRNDLRRDDFRRNDTRRDHHQPSQPCLIPPKRPPPPSRPQLQTPVKVRNGPRPGTLARRERAKPVSLPERSFLGCSPVHAYEVSVKLGQGTFGEVKQGKQLSTGRSVALKKVTIYDAKDGLPITALREIKLLKALNHPHIISVIDMAYRPSSERGKMGEVYMVEPYMDHDLNGLLDNPNVQLPMNQIKLYMRELLEGMMYLHKNRIMHRDMKAANLLIDNNGQLQIADFGLARPFHDFDEAWRTRGWVSTHNYTEMVVTRWYRPPELLVGQRNYGPAIDMWGVGCILAEMITRKPIFKGTSEMNQLELIAALCGSPNDDNFPGWSKLPGVKNATPSGRPDNNPNIIGRHDFGRHPRVVKQHFTTVVDCGRECADLIDRLLVLDPAKRLTAAEALEHEWFWTKPFPADPASLPKYLPSKEIDRNKRVPHNGMPMNPVGRPPIMTRPPPSIIPPGGMQPRPPAAPHGSMAVPTGMPPRPPPRLGGSGAYPPLPRLPAAPSTGTGYGRPKDYGWYNPSAPRGSGGPPPRPY